MADIEFTFDDTDFQKKLKEFVEKGLNDELSKGLEKACLYVETDAKKNCPVDDGQLRQSITHQIDTENAEGVIGTNVEYGVYLEIGTGIYSTQGTGRKDPWVYQDAKGNWHYTHGAKAHPFLQPALENNRTNILESFKDLF